MSKYDTLIKAVVIGDPGVGKTAFTQRAECRTKIPDKHHTATIGVDLGTCIVNVGPDAKVKFHLWDTAGQEQFANLTRSFYRKTHVAILMYDVHRQETATHLLSRWWGELSANTDVSELVVAVVGNKIDLPKADILPAISTLLDLIRQTARAPALHFQISTLCDYDVQPVLIAIARRCLERFNAVGAGSGSLGGGNLRSGSIWLSREVDPQPPSRSCSC